MLLLAGCQASALISIRPPLNPQGHSTSLPVAKIVPTLDPPQAEIPTPVLVHDSSSSSQGESVSVQAPTPLSDPLRFVFPTPAPPPVSAWRPPLYPSPWAMSPYDHFYFARPIAADEVNWPEADYRYGGVLFGDTVHTGVDIPVPKGTPVLAAGSGKVIWAGFGFYHGYYDPNDPYGIAVAIHHDFGYQGQELYTLYGHLDQVKVAVGQYVKTGDLLGLSGQTGNATGPHLHFEVRVGNNDYFKTQNPELWLVPPQGWGVLAGRVLITSGLLAHGQDIVLTSKSTNQHWLAKTYGSNTVNSDAYYQENVVISDLPAGSYVLHVPYFGFDYSLDIEIHPGLVNYFTFKGRYGYINAPPPTPTAQAPGSPAKIPSP